MKTSSTFSPGNFRSERGIALVLTLGILALVTLLMIAFVTSMRVENIASKTFNDVIKARQLAQGAVDEAVSKIREAAAPPTTTRTWVATPGAIHIITPSGITRANLYTDPTPSTAGTNNLNAGYLITGSNSFYNSFANSAITAGWANVTASIGGTTELMGRYAYWVDVEATKVNVNSAKMREPVQVNDSNPTNIDLRALSAPFYNASVGNIDMFYGSHTNPPAAPWFTTLEEMRSGWPGLMSYPDFDANKFFTTVGTSDTNTDAFGRSRIDITAITSETAPEYIEAYNRMSDDTWATRLYVPSGVPIDPNRNTLKKKYGEYGARQILANIIDYQRPHTTPAIGNTGNNPFFGGAPNLDPVTRIPQFYSGLKNGPNINEIIVHVATNYVASDLQLRVFVDVKVSNGYTNLNRGNGYVFKIEPASIELWYTNPVGNVNLTVNEETKVSQRDVSNYGLLGSFSAGTRLHPTTALLPPEWSTTVLATTGQPVATNVVVKLKRVRLLTPPGNDDNIVDWMTQSDFDTLFPAGMKFPDPAYNSLIIPYVTPVGSAVNDSPTFAYSSSALIDRSRPVALGKHDPRTRTFLGLASSDLAAGASNFQTNWVALGAGEVRPTGARGVRGHRLCPENYGLLADVRFIEPGSGTSVSHIWLDNIKETPLVSLGELTYLHTGYPWRSLRFRSIIPQTAPTGSPYPYAEPQLGAPYSGVGEPNTGLLDVEANALPDWILFDIFTIGPTTTYQGRINVNTRFSAVANSLTPRLVPLAALINNVSTNLSTTFAATTGTNILNATATAGIAYNIANRVFVPSSPYQSLPAYFTPGEICEVRNLGYYTDTMTSATYTDQPSKERRQQLIRRISNLFTARSNTFTIWASAQTIKKVDRTDLLNYRPDLGDYISGEVRTQVILDRYEGTPLTGGPGDVKFRTRYYRFIYD